MKIIESPRDGLQGIDKFIPTKNKIEYYNLLLKIGFDILDFGAFSSPKSIPQMRDTGDVVNNLIESDTKLLAIVPNLKGAEIACQYSRIDYLGYPFSISETFLEKNINSNIEKSFKSAISIINRAKMCNKSVVIYFSMGFGNPYNDNWSIELMDKYIKLFVQHENVKLISISDTIGCSTPEQIKDVFTYFIYKYPHKEFGFHLHTKKKHYYDRLKSAYDAGVREYDTVIGGLGGCPSALSSGKLISNMETKTFIKFCNKENIDINIDLDKLEEARIVLKNLIE